MWFIYLFLGGEDVGVGVVGWLEGVFFVEVDCGREGVGMVVEGFDVYGVVVLVLFSGVGWGWDGS